MARFPKPLALLALLAAGCTDKFAPPAPPLDSFYYPVGIAVRPLADGRSALIVVSSNFDLRYDEGSGGTVIAVDPDASEPVQPDGSPGTLAVLGAVNIASFGGEIAWTDAVDRGTAWRPPGSYCPELAADPVLAAGGARLVVASRALLELYRIDMDAAGALSLPAGGTTQLAVQYLDPYGVSLVCSSRSGTPTADAYVTHLRGQNVQGWVSRLDLRTGEVLQLGLGDGYTYSSAYDDRGGWLFVSTRIGTGAATLRWFDPLLPPATVTGDPGIAFPSVSGVSVASIVTGGLTRDAAVSNDRTRLYVSVAIIDESTYLQTGQIFVQGGALAVFDLTPTAFNQPRMALLNLVPTCLGSGQVRVLPPRPGKGDLVALTCDGEGALALYDEQARKLVRYVALDPTTGVSELGQEPFGLAVETFDGARALPGSPCVAGRPCDRVYAASFIKSVVNLLELDPDEPAGMTLVKRIGGGP